MSETPSNLPKPKKSVALSGTAAGNTALCSVGRSGNDLHYRGYDITQFATAAEFEEVAYLLVHGKLPSKPELAGYKAKLKSLRGIPAAVKAALEELPPSAHPMDVMRTGVSVLGCVAPEKDDHNTPARATSPTSCGRRWVECAVLVPLQPQRRGHRRRDRRRLHRRPFLHCCTASRRRRAGLRASTLR